MKRALSKILAVVSAFIALFVSVFRGRTVHLEPETIPEKTTGNADKAAATPALVGFWFEGIRRMTLYAIEGVYQLDMLLHSSLILKDRFLPDLTVSVTLRREHVGIAYVPKDGKVNFMPPCEYRFALEPRSEWDRAHSKRNIELDESDFVSNAMRIELAQGSEKRVFIRSTTGFFLPATNRAA